MPSLAEDASGDDDLVSMSGSDSVACGSNRLGPREMSDLASQFVADWKNNPYKLSDINVCEWSCLDEEEQMLVLRDCER